MGTDYRQYPFSKGYHPRSWAECSVGNVMLEIRSGYSSGKHNQSGQGIPHLRPMNVSPVGEISMEDVRYVSPDAGSPRLADKDVLFTNTSSTIWVGKTALVENPGDWGFSNHMTRLRVADGMSPEFVARQLQYLCICGYFAFHCKKHINQSSVSGRQLAKDVPFRLPPVNEQKRIASQLRRLLLRERRLRAQLDALPELIKRFRAAVLEAACTGHLVPTEAELARKERRDYEPASVLLERILHARHAKWDADQVSKMRASGKEPKDDKWKERYKEPEQPEVNGGAPLPRGWSNAAVGQCGFVQLGRQRSPEKRSKNYPCPYIRAANITEVGIDVRDVLDMDFPPDEFARFRLEVGDLLLSEASGSPAQVGKPAIWGGEVKDCCFQNTVIRLKPVTLGSEFLLLVFKFFYTSGAFARVASGVGINHLGANKFSRMAVPLPPLAEQVRIVAEVKRRLSVVTIVEDQVTAALEQTTQLRVSLFHRALSGELVSQSPRDEPAEQLLKRIATAREARAAEQKKSKSQRMKKPKPRKAVHLADELFATIKKQFGTKRFVFEQLVQHLPDDYESVKIEIFNLLARTRGQRLKQVFDPKRAQMELQGKT